MGFNLSVFFKIMELDLMKQLEIDVMQKLLEQSQHNLSSIIGFFQLVIAVMALVFAGISIFIGWYFKRNFDKKIENAEKIEKTVLLKEKSVEEIFNNIKAMEKDQERHLKDIEEIKKQLGDLRDIKNSFNTYFGYVEEVLQMHNLQIRYFDLVSKIEPILSSFDEDKIEELYKDMPEVADNPQECFNYYFSYYEEAKNNILLSIQKKFSIEEYLKIDYDEHKPSEELIGEIEEIKSYLDHLNKVNRD